MCFDVFFKLFDAKIQPILLYGAEVWGMDNCDLIESVHLFAMKSFLNVSSRTPNVMIYGDTGRFPLSINAKLRSIKYWLKVLNMSDDRLPKRVYDMNLCTSISNSWVSKIKSTLEECDYEEVWTNQRVPNERSFLRSIREKLISKFHADWESRVMSSPRYSFYRLFKSSCELEQYLYAIDKKIFRDIYVRFRMDTTDLYIH